MIRIKSRGRYSKSWGSKESCCGVYRIDKEVVERWGKELGGESG